MRKVFREVFLRGPMRCLFAVFLALVFCVGVSVAPTEATGKKVIVQGMNQDPDILDTIKAAWYSDALIYLHDRLVTRDYNFQYQPGLAESWETSGDGLVWTFHLKKGVRFHDGSPFTAKDVKWTFDTIKDPETASPFAGDLKAIEKIVIRDDYTVDFILGYPFPNLLFNLSNTAAGIQPENCYEKYGSDYGIKTVIGTGPFIFKEWIKGDKIVLLKNPDYAWGPAWMSNQGPPLFDELVIRTIPEETVRFMELETGGIHILREARLPGLCLRQEALHRRPRPSGDQSRHRQGYDREVHLPGKGHHCLRLPPAGPEGRIP
ncbi:MAG: ABC-type dipeptide transport system, periplasmic component [Synergistales bacterium 58_81]|nr:MAG: ABC-type dipeptide transport system, periplasmic component [Synergistales bacterium 58_81]